MEEVESLSVAVEQEAAANLAEIRAIEERQPAPTSDTERGPARDDRGRYQSANPPLNEDSLRHRLDIEELKNARLISDALADGLIHPSDEMDPSLWAKAFEGRQRAAERTGGSTTTQPVESESESTDSEPEPDQAGGADVELVSAYNQRAQAFVQDHPDFGQVIDGLELPARIAKTVEQAILEEENGPSNRVRTGKESGVG